MNPIEIAIDNIQTYGWVQEKYVDRDTGARCLRGAFITPASYCNGRMTEAIPVDDAIQRDRWLAHDLVFQTITEQYGNGVHSIIEWNDQTGREAKEVITVLEKALAKWKERQ